MDDSLESKLAALEMQKLDLIFTHGMANLQNQLHTKYQSATNVATKKRYTTFLERINEEASRLTEFEGLGDIYNSPFPEEVVNSPFDYRQAKRIRIQKCGPARVLAEVLLISKATIYFYENGKTNPFIVSANPSLSPSLMVPSLRYGRWILENGYIPKVDSKKE